MKGKKKLFLLLLIVLIIIIIVVVVVLTCKPKQKADILNTASSADTQPKLSVSTVPATTMPATTASTTTQPPSIFQGYVTGDWSGQVAEDPPADIAGTFLVTIDAKGDVSGSFEGSYSGTIKGVVDLNGNLSAIGTASVGGASYVITWKGKLTVSGKSLSAQGDLSAPFVSGKFSGKGTASD